MEKERELSTFCPSLSKGCVQDPLYPCPYPVLQVRFPMLNLCFRRGVQPCLIPISCRAALFQHSCIHHFFVMPFGSSHHRWLFGGEEVCSVPCLDVVLTDLLGSPCFLYLHKVGCCSGEQVPCKASSLKDLLSLLCFVQISYI